MANGDTIIIFCRDVLVSWYFICLSGHPTDLSRYVAMHTMQENDPSGTSRESPANGYGDPRDSQSKPDKSMRDLVASVVGMILPLFLQIGHAH